MKKGHLTEGETRDIRLAGCWKEPQGGAAHHQRQGDGARVDTPA